MHKVYFGAKVVHNRRLLKVSVTVKIHASDRSSISTSCSRTFRADTPDLYNLWLMLPDGSRLICMVQERFPGLDLYHTDPAQHIIPAG